MDLAALLVQPHPGAHTLHIDGLDKHGGRCAHTGEGVDHEPDQRAIAQAHHGRYVDRIEHGPHLFRGQNGSLSFADGMSGFRTEQAGFIGMT